VNSDDFRAVTQVPIVAQEWLPWLSVDLVNPWFKSSQWLIFVHMTDVIPRYACNSPA
jgi:hypothetical protein